jgi:hypothetical protein
MSIESHCDAFELGKSRGIQNREWLLKKKAGDALKREAKAEKKARKIAAREKQLKKDAKKIAPPTTLEEFMPPKVAEDSFAYTKYLNTRMEASPVKSDDEGKSEEISDIEDDCVLVDDLERGFDYSDMDCPEDGWALL